MIKENVPAAEADKLVEEGGRILYRRPSPSGEGVLCDVEMPGNGGSDTPAPPPPPPAVEDESDESDESTA